MPGTSSAVRVTSQLAHDVVDLARRAPSVHNTQPWTWRWDGRALELYADPSRALPLTDPEGRNLVLSCGAALHHARTALHALGRGVSVERFPEGPDAGPLARLELHPEPDGPALRSVRGTTPRETVSPAAAVDAILRRSTDRRRFTSWPVPAGRLLELASVAAIEGATATALLDVTERLRVELLVGRALDRQSGDRALALEQDAWVDHGPVDGVPAGAIPGPGDPTAGPRHRFSPSGDDGGQLVRHRDGLVVLSSPTDDPAGWLRAGEGLSALWLSATVGGLAVVPLSSVVEVEETRDRLRYDVLDGRTHPLVLLRVGWSAIGRDGLVRTPRRPVDEVLEDRSA
ncbi:Acg family FMN-binding oxidoreductase [Lapillicoccus jejuensis]|uniref:Nitroreductase family protein n=1 Tax=Lapillicoccus jejuensis TaxID=402171 RepID=A0A542E135_9MICO|nr:hypothetical protein [Lapillicoccus jejuensis]TQJ09032.1 hypothetical protein FB458_2136 [Lapillicoccus jejuensis]